MRASSPSSSMMARIAVVIETVQHSSPSPLQAGARPHDLATETWLHFSSVVSPLSVPPFCPFLSHPRDLHKTCDESSLGARNSFKDNRVERGGPSTSGLCGSRELPPPLATGGQVGSVPSRSTTQETRQSRPAKSAFDLQSLAGEKKLPCTGQKKGSASVRRKGFASGGRKILSQPTCTQVEVRG